MVFFSLSRRRWDVRDTLTFTSTHRPWFFTISDLAVVLIIYNTTGGFDFPSMICISNQSIKQKPTVFSGMDFHDFDTIFRFKSYVCGSEGWTGVANMLLWIWPIEALSHRHLEIVPVSLFLLLFRETPVRTHFFLYVQRLLFLWTSCTCSQVLGMI